MLIIIAVPPKGLPTSGPALTHSFIADEPNTKLSSDNALKFGRVNAFGRVIGCEPMLLYHDDFRLYGSNKLLDFRTALIEAVQVITHSN